MEDLKRVAVSVTESGDINPSGINVHLAGVNGAQRSRVVTLGVGGIGIVDNMASVIRFMFGVLYGEAGGNSEQRLRWHCATSYASSGNWSIIVGIVIPELLAMLRFIEV